MKSKFKIYSPITKSNELNEDGALTLEGIASTTSIDLQRDVVSEQAIKSMKEYAAKLNIHANHDYNLFDGLIGHITEVLESDSKTLKIKFIILPEYASKIKSMLDAGVKLGLSIGGDVVDWKEQETPDGMYVWIIEDIILFEVSLTPMPANWDSFATVTTSKGLVESKCLTGACYEIIKKIKKDNGDNMKKNNVKKEEDEGSEEGSNTMDETKVTEMINEALTAFKESEIPTLKEEIKSELLDELKQEETAEEGSTEENSEETGKELDSDELEKQITEKVEEKLFKKLGLERDPTHSEPDQKEKDSDDEQKPNNSLKMSRKDIAKNLAESRSNTGLSAIIQAIKGEE